jgi:hypothetical protein
MGNPTDQSSKGRRMVSIRGKEDGFNPLVSIKYE